MDGIEKEVAFGTSGSSWVGVGHRYTVLLTALNFKLIIVNTPETTLQ